MNRPLKCLGAGIEPPVAPRPAEPLRSRSVDDRLGVAEAKNSRDDITEPVPLHPYVNRGNGEVLRLRIARAPKTLRRAKVVARARDVRMSESLVFLRLPPHSHA